jgi:hypothetical protein
MMKGKKPALTLNPPLEMSFGDSITFLISGFILIFSAVLDNVIEFDESSTITVCLVDAELKNRSLSWTYEIPI